MVEAILISNCRTALQRLTYSDLEIEESCSKLQGIFDRKDF